MEGDQQTVSLGSPPYPSLPVLYRRTELSNGRVWEKTLNKLSSAPFLGSQPFCRKQVLFSVLCLTKEASHLPWMEGEEEKARGYLAVPVTGLCLVHE